MSIEGGSALSQSMFASVRNLADDSVQETARMVQVLQDVNQAWQTTRTMPGAAEQVRQRLVLLLGGGQFIEHNNINGKRGDRKIAENPVSARSASSAWIGAPA